MTYKERAVRVARQPWDETRGTLVLIPFEGLVDDVTKEIREAVLEEREANAALVESKPYVTCQRSVIAAAIRSRGEQ